MASFKFLTDNNLSLKTVWAWARQLVQDLNKMNVQISNSAGAPSGSVQVYAGTTPPVGWLLCDGGSYSIDAYSTLFAAIGYFWGGAGPTFNVPDFRGVYLVGAGAGLALGATTTGGSVATQDLSSLDVIDVEAGKRRVLTAKIAGASSDALGEGELDMLPPSVGINVIIKV